MIAVMVVIIVVTMCLLVPVVMFRTSPFMPVTLQQEPAQRKRGGTARGPRPTAGGNKGHHTVVSFRAGEARMRRSRAEESPECSACKARTLGPSLVRWSMSAALESASKLRSGRLGAARPPIRGMLRHDLGACRASIGSA